MVFLSLPRFPSDWTLYNLYILSSIVKEPNNHSVMFILSSVVSRTILEEVIHNMMYIVRGVMRSWLSGKHPALYSADLGSRYLRLEASNAA